MKLHVFTIKTMMGSKGMTQADLAGLMGVKPQAISKILCSGRCSPISAVRIAGALNVAVEEIVKED